MKILEWLAGAFVALITVFTILLGFVFAIPSLGRYWRISRK